MSPLLISRLLSLVITGSSGETRSLRTNRVCVLLVLIYTARQRDTLSGVKTSTWLKSGGGKMDSVVAFVALLGLHQIGHLEIGA